MIKKTMKKLHQQTYKVIRVLLQYLKQEERTASCEEKNNLWECIQYEVVLQKKRRQRHVFYMSVSIAASIALILTVGLLFHYNTAHILDTDLFQQYALLTDSANSLKHVEDIQLKLSDGKNVLVQQSKVISYSSGNKIVIGADTIDFRSKKGGLTEIDQIITPPGKQVQMILADGTRLWINAGTHVMYPHQFQKGHREIFVNGEVYLEVARNEQVPFFVRTKDFYVQVLGTKFNVNSYNSTSGSSVVLVEGSVKVEGKSQEEIVLTPNQYISIQHGKLASPIEVDVKEYVSWVDNLLVYNTEKPLTDVLRKLELYYDKKIKIVDNMEDIRVSGKLELKNDFSKVLHSLSHSFPITFEERSDTVFVRRNNN